LKLPASNVPLWIEPRSAPRLGPLRGVVEADVVVVGAGITGLTAALLLQQAGRQVVVLEARGLAEGVSGHTTAHVTEAVDTGYSTIRSDFGRDGARAVARSSRAAIELIRSLARTVAPRSEFTAVPGFLYTESAEGRDALEDEMEAARDAGLVVSLTREVPLPFAVEAAVRFEDQARFHPRRYLIGIAEEILRRGGRIFTGTRVVDFDSGTPSSRVETERGPLSAAHVLFATHSPLNRLFLQTKIYPYRSYVLALRVDRPVGDALFWDTVSPYHYVRQQRVGREDLLIVGGEDHKVGHESDTFACYERLLGWARDRFAVRSVEHRWSAQVLEPADGLPYVGPVPQAPNVLVATGYSGNGMTFGTLAAILMRDRVLEHENEWAELYSAGRVKPIAAAKDFVVENADVAARFVLDRLRAGSGDADSVPRGKGVVIERDGERMAVYRSEHGAVSAVSAVCTHLGCVVNWNTAERTWDCPCHGSRFALDGSVVDGPATRPLEVRDGAVASGDAAAGGGNDGIRRA
jgi:glycine/D-amino acid oxidase-like deaminating enzyme/nitrite reductase/ring-hydroxylating ferredoxin subunit